MKTFKSIGMAILAIGIYTNFISCSDDGKESPIPNQSAIEEFTQSNMNFTEKVNEQTFTFTTNADWTISVAPIKGGENWCTASPTQGNAGNQTVKIAVVENSTYDDRSVTVTLKSGTESKSFVVTQKQKDALLLTSDKVEINQTGGDFTIEVKANINYTAIIGEDCKDWIKEKSNTRTLSTTTKTYSAAVNEDNEKREGTITFTNGTLSETVHIYQAGGDIILLSKNEYNIDATGEDITVELRSNCEYEVEMPKVDWIHEISTRAMSSHTLYYSVDANETYESREAEIIYRNKTMNIADTLNIIQAQKDAIILGKKTIEVKAEGETIEIKLSTNIAYEVEMPDVNWITSTTTRSLTEHTLYYKVAKNENENSRTANITFIKKEDELKERLTIIQYGNRPEIVLIDVPFAGELSNITQRKDFKALKLTGYLNGNDVKVIRRMHELKYLDLSEASIKGGDYYIVENNYNGGNEVFLEENTIGPVMFSNEQEIPSPFEKLEEVLLPHSVTTIERYAFKNINSLRKIELPNNLKTICEFAFWRCSNLTSITIPNRVTTIENDAFRECKNLYSIIIPDNVTIIENGAFMGCENLSEVNLSKNLTAISYHTFCECYNLKSIIIPDGVVRIGDSAFRECKNLNKVSIPNTVTDIEDWAFYKCKSITSITLPYSIKNIGELAFNGCSISNVTIPQNVTKIESGAFNKLNEVRILCTTPPSGYIKCDKLYIPKGTYQKYFLSNWGAYATDIIEMEE